MNNNISTREVDIILNFIRLTMKRAKKNSVCLGLSGGVDSAVCLMLLISAIGRENIFILQMPYKNFNKTGMKLSQEMIEYTKFPQENLIGVDITNSVDTLRNSLGVENKDRIRLGNIIARTRMIVLFDTAKRTDSLVCGTENKSENILGYFTRFGDQASDMEPIEDLYKTQVYRLAEYLNIPKSIIEAKPSAALWENQTDERQLGFSYEEADQVMHNYVDRRIDPDTYPDKYSSFPNYKKIILRIKDNKFKSQVPYRIKIKY